jgi:hypothetical protein
LPPHEGWTVQRVPQRCACAWKRVNEAKGADKWLRCVMPGLRLCPSKTNSRCGGRLRVIAAVQAPLAVQAILAHQARAGAPARRAVGAKICGVL